MYRYAAQRTTRNKKLLLAILVGVIIATTLFTAANIGANSLIGAMITEGLETVYVDMTWDSDTWETIPSCAELYDLRQEIESVEGVTRSDLVIRHRNNTYSMTESIYRYTIGIQPNSTAYNGISLTSGNMTLGANETLMWIDSALITDFPIGSNYSISIDIYEQMDYWMQNITLKVVGYVELNTQAQEIIAPGTTQSYYPTDQLSLFLVDSESTFLPVLDNASSDPDVLGISLEVSTQIFVDRAIVINPYNMQLSMQNVQQLGYQIENGLRAANYRGWLNNELYWAIMTFSSIAEAFRMIFLQVSIPVFFIALYMGITLNDVSYSIRRREVGLLLTKGVTRGTITSLFVWEALFIGLVASFIGIGIGILITPYFIVSVTWVSILVTGIGVDTIFLTIIFGVLLAVFASYLPARKAVQIPTTEAIREYTLAGEPTGFPRMLAWTCLILGAYKLVIWLSGFSVSLFAYSLLTTNPILGSLAAFWVTFDTIMTFWAPLLFLWGLTTIIVKGWKGFYRYTQAFISRVLGELGGLASHNIQRRPARTAAIIFITALLVGYGVQTIGILGSNYDLATRDAYTSVGADIDVKVNNPENVTDLLPVIRDITGVRAATSQYTFTVTTVYQSIEFRAINVSEWRGVGYYESEWISGVPAQSAFDALGSHNHTIILERVVAVYFSVDIGDVIAIQFASNATYYPLSIMGFMGPEPIVYQNPWGWGSSFLAEETWSYVPIELMLNHSMESFATGHVLISLESPANNADVVATLEALDDVRSVESAITLIEEYNADVLRSSATNMMQMGVVFAFILASIGTFVIIYLTLRERRTTTALMSARGMTYAQTVVILLAEILTMMIFAIVIGFVVGLIIYFGLVSGGTAAIPPLLTTRFLPPTFLGMFLLQNVVLIGLLLLTTIVPILIEARTARYDLSILR